jgi:hypothetical protein
LDTLYAASFTAAERDGASMAGVTDVWLAWRLPNQ